MPISSGLSNYFNPRPPRGGRRSVLRLRSYRSGNFNPRPPRGGRRSVLRLRSYRSGNFNPRPPRGGRPIANILRPFLVSISIHALREEGDAGKCSDCSAAHNFNPRPPRGGRLAILLPHAVLMLISIHALREEGDYRLRFRWSWPQDFNPRPPRGGRPEQQHKASTRKKFQSTPSARRATRSALRIRQTACISIHALREEGDAFITTSKTRPQYFNPRPPRGGRPQRIRLGQKK